MNQIVLESRVTELCGQVIQQSLVFYEVERQCRQPYVCITQRIAWDGGEAHDSYMELSCDMIERLAAAL